jgi:hypothetical protein
MPCTPSARTCMQDARGVDLCTRLRVQPMHAFEGPTVFLLAVRQSFFFCFSSTLINFQTLKHAPTALPYVLTVVGLYRFDHLARIARTRYATGWLTAEHALNGGTTLVHVPSSRLACWPTRPGSHCQQCVVWVVGDLVPLSCTTVHKRGGIRLWWHTSV